MPELPRHKMTAERRDYLLDQVRAGRHFGALLLSEEVKKRGGQTSWLNNHVGIVDIKGQRLLIDGYFLTESTLGLRICGDKVLTKQFLTQHDISTPLSFVVATEQQALEAWQRIEGPVVVKPRRGRKGKGVSVNVASESSIVDAFLRAAESSSDVLVEQYIEAESELRVMASSSTSLVVNKRIPANVVGNGRLTVRQLIRRANKRRRVNPSLIHRPILIDGATTSYLTRQGLSLDEVPDQGETVSVSDSGGLSRGGETFQYYEQADERVRAIGPAAINAIPGLDWGGIDVIIERETGVPYVIEINAGAGGYGAAFFPSFGPERDVIDQVWNLRETSVDWEVGPRVPATGRSDSGMHLNEYAPELFNRSEKIMLSELVLDSVRGKGGRVSKYSRGLIEVAFRGDVSLMGVDLMAATDKCVATRSARRHSTARSIMKLSSVPLVPGRIVENASEVREFAMQAEGAIVLTPALSQWAGSGTRVVATDTDEMAELDELNRRYVVQARPPGLRARVLAGPNQVFAILSKHHASLFDEVTVRSAGRVAVEAVRAVPELRWAAVDLLVYPKRKTMGRPNAIEVEGITLAPKVSAGDSLVVNNLELFYSLLFGPLNHRA